MESKFPDGWIPATEKMEVAPINDHGTMYLVEKDVGWLWMKDIPGHLENRC